jgi:thioredoxin reductase (NADPH)
VYAASEGLDTLVIEREVIGGQAGSTSLIRNYLGFSRGVSGSELGQRAYQQARVCETEFLLMHEATGVRADGDRLLVSVSDGDSVSARTVILAMGVTYRRLEARGLDELSGAGVFYGASNVEILTWTEVVGAAGDGRLRELTLRNVESGEEQSVPADGAFILIGARPHTEWLPDSVECDRRGFVLTGADAAEGESWPLQRAPLMLETSLPGAFAAGDVRHRSTKRVAAAAGQGAAAVQQIHEYLTEAKLHRARELAGDRT